MAIKNIKLDNFTLKSVKKKNGGLSIKYVETGVFEENPYRKEIDAKTDYAAHEDLQELFERGALFIIKAYDLDTVGDVAAKYLKGEQKTKVDEKQNEILSKIEVTGFSIGGSDSLEGMVISGKITSFNGAKCAMNTPRIVFDSDKIGLEDEARQLSELLTMEVYKHLYSGKQAQLDLFEQETDEKKAV